MNLQEALSKWMSRGGDDDDYQDEDIIPGDNDKPLPNGGPPEAPDTAPNLTQLPASGGEVPNTQQPRLS